MQWQQIIDCDTGRKYWRVFADSEAEPVRVFLSLAR